MRKKTGNNFFQCLIELKFLWSTFTFRVSIYYVLFKARSFWYMHKRKMAIGKNILPFANKRAYSTGIVLKLKSLLYATISWARALKKKCFKTGNIMRMPLKRLFHISYLVKIPGKQFVITSRFTWIRKVSGQFQYCFLN